MAINATAQWWVRTDGNNTNGGGYDAAISGAGTNYCDQAAAQLTLTDLATSGAGVTTLTSATGGFTSAMIGNCIRISAGTNFQTGYYFVTARTDTNTVTLDRTPSSGGAGSAGSGTLGGAFATLQGSLTNANLTPTITSPLAAGHTINLRGTGSDLPSSADYTIADWISFASGDSTSGNIKLLGYNGRPRIDPASMMFNASAFWSIENVMFKANGGGFGTIVGGTGTGEGLSCTNCVFDLNGYDISAVKGNNNFVTDCYIYNSGGTSAGTSYALDLLNYKAVALGNTIIGTRGGGISAVGGAIVLFNVIANTKGTTPHGIRMEGFVYPVAVGNSIYGVAGSGIGLVGANDILSSVVMNNVLVNCGAYGVTCAAGATALNDRRIAGKVNYNAFYNNTSGARNAYSAGANDVTLTGDPFTNAGSSDFSLNSTAGAGAACKAAGYPGPFRRQSFTGYLDIGAVQRQEAASISIPMSSGPSIVIGRGISGY